MKSAITVTFLGTGTSQGVPVIGCECAVCRSEDPRDQRLRSSILIERGDYRFVIDTTPDFRTQCLRAGLKRLDAVVYTHAHVDHILGFDDLRRFCELEDKAMPIYAAADVLEALQRIYPYAFAGEVKYRNYIRPAPRLIDGPFQLADLEVVPLSLPHGKITLNGYLILCDGVKRLAYFTDCHEVPAAALREIVGVRALVVDTLRRKPHPTHMSVEQSLEVARMVRPGITYGIHMCHDLPHAETERNLPPDFRLAYDGLSVEL